MKAALKKYIWKKIIGFEKEDDIKELMNYIEENTKLLWIDETKPTYFESPYKETLILYLFINFEDGMTFWIDASLEEWGDKKNTVNFKDFMNAK